MHVGPLPDPVSLEAYEKAIPGAGERIIRMAETEQRHTHRLAYAGVVVSLAGMGVSAALIVFGHTTGVIIFAIAALAAPVGRLLKSRLVSSDLSGSDSG